MDASCVGESAAFQFWVIVNLTSDLISRIFMSGVLFLYYLREESQIWCVNASLNGGVWHTFLDHLDLVSKIIVSGARLSPRIFEAGIQNLVCGCILEWRSVVYHFGSPGHLTYFLQ